MLMKTVEYGKSTGFIGRIFVDDLYDFMKNFSNGMAKESAVGIKDREFDCPVTAGEIQILLVYLF